MNEQNTCANCGWPADNCSLCYDLRGRLALPLSDTADAVIRPGCRLCYTLQILGRSDLAGILAQRKDAVESRCRALQDASTMLDVFTNRLKNEIRKIF